MVDSYLEYSIPVISVGEAYEDRDAYIFLDAREIEEFNVSHITNAIHTGYDNFDILKIQSQVSNDAQLIVYCSIGYRSEKIGEILKKNGYQNVYNLYGSIFEWVNQHRPICHKNGIPASILHTYSKKWSKWVDNEDVQLVW